MFAFIVTAVLAQAAVPDKAIDPAALKDKVTISVGKKLVVQFKQAVDALTDPRVVAKPADDPPTVSFDFRNQNDMIILSTKNPFRKDLQFRALARHKDRKDFFETSIVPVKAGLFSFELWQEPIEELVLFEFKLVDDKP